MIKVSKLTKTKITTPAINASPTNQYSNPKPAKISIIPNTKYANLEPTYIILSVSTWLYPIISLSLKPLLPTIE